MGAEERHCVECGCTEDSACWDHTKGAPCHWAEGLEDVCSACEHSTTVQVNLNCKLVERLHSLLQSGYYGHTAEDVVERLLCERLRDLEDAVL